MDFLGTRKDLKNCQFVYFQGAHYSYSSRSPRDKVGKLKAHLSQIANKKRQLMPTNQLVEKFNFSFMS